MPFPTPGDLPDPEIKPASLALARGCYATEPPGKHAGEDCHFLLQWIFLTRD